MEKHSSSQFSDYLFVQMQSSSASKVECIEPPSNTNHDNNNKELTGMRKWLTENLLLILTLMGVCFGVALGFGLRPFHPSANTIKLLSYPGELFMRILKLLILPLIISSLVAGSASLNARLNGRIAVRTLIYFLLTSIINAVLGVVLAVCIHPGYNNASLAKNNASTSQSNNESRGTSSVLDTLLDLGRNIVADNIFQATFQQSHTAYVNSSVRVFNETTGAFDSNYVTESIVKYRPGTNTLGIVCFCLCFGTILGTMGSRSKIVIEFFAIILDVVMKMVTGVIWLTPIGIVSVIAGKILSVANISIVITQLGWFIISVIVGVYIYQLFIMQFIYLLFVRKNPFKFYMGLVQGMLTAFATASTAAALPITFTLMEDKLKVDKRITRFVLPIGCNINMDGTALFIAVATVFVAQMNGVALSIGELITVCFTATAASFSSASVPSAALVLLLMVLSTIDIPDKDVFLLFAIDWLVDRFRTTNNMLGDCYTAAVVEKLSKKELMACDAILSQDEGQPADKINEIVVVDEIKPNGVVAI